MELQLRHAVLVLVFIVSEISGQAHHLKIHELNGKCTLIEDDFLPKYRGFDSTDENEIKTQSKAAMSISEGSIVGPNNGGNIVEVFARKSQTAENFMASLCTSTEKLEPFNMEIAAAHEVRRIIDGGDPKNRIDVVFMGDGYTASERDQFFSDMERLTARMFKDVTFRSYLPLFNIWAIYAESEESGIGYDGGPKNTAFGLYRYLELGLLRAIFPTHVHYGRQVCTLTGASACDFPSIIGNDDFMGGLGGEFVIATKSEKSGTFTLNHEMVHNYLWAGDEYDNGPTYMGVNTAESLDTLGWDAWLTDGKKEERAMYRLFAYPWADLTLGPQIFNFTSDGQYSRWDIVLTVSGAAEEDSVEFLLDDQVLPWKTNGYDDRDFYTWFGNEGFTAGIHTLTVRAKKPPTHPFIPRMICHIRIYEYGNEDEFHMSNDYVSAYPLWGEDGMKRYRPTSEGCLMRNVTSDNVCPVCKEGMWVKFLERMGLIDNITISENTQNGTREVTVETPNLGARRLPGNEVPGETLEVKWFKGREEQVSLRDKLTINAEVGNWTVEVHLNTPEVRNDPRNMMTSTESFIVQ